MSIIDLGDKEELAREIANGRVWSGPGWAIQQAVDAINNGDVPMPSYIPDEYRGYITRLDEPMQHVEPMTSGGEQMPLPMPEAGGEPLV